MIRQLPLAHSARTAPGLPPCEHRAVAADGRITCKKIVRGDNSVTAAVCGACPFQEVDCTHLRFALHHVSPTPLVVRFNGRTEVWNDEPPALRFEQAACAVQVLPIASAHDCAGCPLRQPLSDASASDAGERTAAAGERAAGRRGCGKVVPFAPPEREAAARAG